jgi:hypothetical protein
MEGNLSDKVMSKSWKLALKPFESFQRARLQAVRPDIVAKIQKEIASIPYDDFVYQHRDGLGHKKNRPNCVQQEYHRLNLPNPSGLDIFEVWNSFPWRDVPSRHGLSVTFSGMGPEVCRHLMKEAIERGTSFCTISPSA